MMPSIATRSIPRPCVACSAAPSLASASSVFESEPPALTCAATTACFKKNASGGPFHQQKLVPPPAGLHFTVAEKINIPAAVRCSKSGPEGWA